MSNTQPVMTQRGKQERLLSLFPRHVRRLLVAGGITKVTDYSGPVRRPR